jgi:hypothetical protein
VFEPISMVSVLADGPVLKPPFANATS